MLVFIQLAMLLICIVNNWSIRSFTRILPFPSHKCQGASLTSNFIIIIFYKLRGNVFFDQVFGAAEWHSADELNARSYFMLHRLLRHTKVYALGEIGLDFSQNPSRGTRELQRRVFVRLLNLAVKTRKPMVVHCQNTFIKCLNILEVFLSGHWKIPAIALPRPGGKDVHAFSNAYIGLTATVTWGREPFCQLGKRVPLHQLLHETDAPYIVPAKDGRSVGILWLSRWRICGEGVSGHHRKRGLRPYCIPYSCLQEFDTQLD